MAHRLRPWCEIRCAVFLLPFTILNFLISWARWRTLFRLEHKNSCFVFQKLLCCEWRLAFNYLEKKQGPKSKNPLFAEFILHEQKKVSKIRKRLYHLATWTFLTTFERMSSDSPISRLSPHKVRDFNADSFCLGSVIIIIIITRWHTSGARSANSVRSMLRKFEYRVVKDQTFANAVA